MTEKSAESVNQHQPKGNSYNSNRHLMQHLKSLCCRASAYHIGTQRAESYLPPESEERKSSEGNSGPITSTIPALCPVRAVFKNRAAVVEVDVFHSPGEGTLHVASRAPRDEESLSSPFCGFRFKGVLETNFCTGDIAPPEPEFGAELILDAREFSGQIFWFCSPAKEAPRKSNPREIDLPKFTFQNSTRKSGQQKSHCAQYDWTTGVLDNGNEWRKFRAVPRLYPLRSLVFYIV